MLTFADASALASQIEQDALIYNAANPGALLPLPVAILQGGLSFAEYTLTQGGNLVPYMPHDSTPPNSVYPNGIAASAGDPAGFITQLYSNDLGRAPTAADITFYEGVISGSPTNAEGYAMTLLYIGVSPESQQHNAHLMVHI